MKYDIIGDIHGHAHELIALLSKMGYGKSVKGHYYHPDRQAIFVGDYIDRGPNSEYVYRIIRQMVEEKSAIALMGNHEYNAICFHTKDSSGAFLREHSIKNIKQHNKTLISFGHQDNLNEAIEWFKSLPFYYENEHFRVIHACWDKQMIEVVKKYFQNSYICSELLEMSQNDQSDLYKAVEIILKGQEITLPNNLSFIDKEGHMRKEIRVKWWENPIGKTYKEYAVNEFDSDFEEYLNNPIVLNCNRPSFYSTNEKTIFFGHYWIEDKKPRLQSSNVCCVDYSVAKEGGKLVAYRFDGENELDENKFIW